MRISIIFYFWRKNQIWINNRSSSKSKKISLELYPISRSSNKYTWLLWLDFNHQWNGLYPLDFLIEININTQFVSPWYVPYSQIDSAIKHWNSRHRCSIHSKKKSKIKKQIFPIVLLTFIHSKINIFIDWSSTQRCCLYKIVHLPKSVKTSDVIRNLNTNEGQSR